MSDARAASATVDRTPLEAGIARLIRAGGPIDVATFMALALGHPTLGYYAARAGLGAGGDFVTAPEVSQLFGELVGLSLAAAWAASGTPSAHLVELGPGNGTLLADLWRGTGRVPGFHHALTVHLVETSPRLRAAQAARLAAIGGLTWHDDLETLPRDRPLLVVANEFFDALPIRQLVKEDGSWHEVRIDLGPDDRLRLGRAAEPSPLGNLLERGQPDGSVVEISPAREAFMAALAERLAGQGGLALIIDYGERDPLPGSTLQAVSNHRRVAPLIRPGEVDLTSHVAFGPLIEIARRAGLGAYGPLPQGDFLERLGAGLRLGQLLAGASGATAERLRVGHRRLTHPEAMGELFKVLAVTSWPGLPPGFAASEAS
jgi:NADH dehydrogenase [ubiquinone] 1 alpha subcomplex assembly factor 7